MNIVVKLQDDVYANILSLEMKYLYKGVLEAAPGAFSRSVDWLYLSGIHAEQKQIRAEGKKGLYLLEPELMEERDFWGIADDPDVSQDVKEQYDIRTKCMKEYQIDAMVRMSGEDGAYFIKLEWYVSKKELCIIPLEEIINRALGSVSFSNIKQFCNYAKWGDM